jgi:ABC-type multidrug transport system ATPase subunit
VSDEKRDAVLETVDLGKSYDDLVALEPLTISIFQGERVALIGRNGSGKTTLIKLAVGLLDPTSGEVRISGEKAGSMVARSRISYISDEPVLYDDLSLAEHIELICSLYGATDWEDRAVQLLDVLGLSSRIDRLPSRFSRGLRQKTAIVLGLIRPYSILIVDEPFVGLDPLGREAFIELLDQAAKGGSTLLIATHQLEFASSVDRCLALRDGSLVFDGPPDDVQLASIVQ